MGSVRKPRDMGYSGVTFKVSISKVLKGEEEEADQLNNGTRC